MPSWCQLRRVQILRSLPCASARQVQTTTGCTLRLPQASLATTCVLRACCSESPPGGLRRAATRSVSWHYTRTACLRRPMMRAMFACTMWAPPESYLPPSPAVIQASAALPPSGQAGRGNCTRQAWTRYACAGTGRRRYRWRRGRSRASSTLLHKRSSSTRATRTASASLLTAAP